MNYEIDLDPTDADISEIRQGLVEHNRPFLGAVRHDKVAFYVTEQGKKKAGITAEIIGDWLSIQFLWVDESIRGTGVGSELLSRVESHAKEVGCHSVLLDTFSFQAKAFYEKHGYQCHMTLENYPSNHSKHYFTKRLV